MTIGTVKFFNFTRGFGYLTATDTCADTYVESSAIADSGLARLREGDRLSFDIVTLPNGKTRAANLKLIERGSVRAESPRVAAEQHFHDANAKQDNGPVRFGDPTAA